MSSFLKACASSDLAEIKEEVAKNPDVVNEIYEVGNREPILVYCIKNKLFEVTAYLLTLPHLNVNLLDGKKRNSLHAAVALGDSEVEFVRRLLSKGVNVEQEDENGDTPLWGAILWHHVAVARVLLKEGKANHRIIDRENGSTPLINCAGNGHLDTIKLMLELKLIQTGDLEYCNLEDAGNLCALDVAMMTGRMEVADLLMAQYEKLKFRMPPSALAGYLMGLEGTANVEAVKKMSDRLRVSPGDPLSWGGVKMYCLQIVMTLEDTPSVQALGKWLFDTYGAPPEDGDETITSQNIDEEALKILDRMKNAAVGTKQSWKSMREI